MKIIRLKYLKRLLEWDSYFSKNSEIGHVIREDEDKNNDSPYVKLNSKFGFANIAINIDRFQRS
jgi:hypothetical protein